MLSVSIKTSYSEENFMIPDWQPDVHTDFYGRKFYDVETYADFYLRGELCFCDEFDIAEIKEATEQELQEYAACMEQDNEELTARRPWLEWNL